MKGLLAGMAISGAALGLAWSQSVASPSSIAVTGTVRFEGMPPAAEVVDMTGDDYCVEAHGGESPSVSSVRVGASGGLADVAVYVTEGVRGEYETPGEEVLLDQSGCMYDPLVLPLQAGQTLVIRNSDATLHNVHAFPEVNRGFNIGQPLKGLESRKVFADPELPIRVACDIHGWMETTVLVLDHPFWATTGEDGGFSLADLPPGDYVVEARHPTLGTQTQRVTVLADQPVALEFTFGG